MTDHEICEWFESIGFTNVIVTREEIPGHIEGPWWELLGGAAMEMFEHAGYFKISTAEGVLGLYYPDETCADGYPLFDIQESGIDVQALSKELGKTVEPESMDILIIPTEEMLLALLALMTRTK
ncbi:MAG: hypothetical protein G01um101448_292 [Parcubacteria group bacterium Gr01-1014_48]|nr:MAG: hypothetical protein Greene041614_610 [Parcubacteria group bacterium Greene0416_14]TSC74182.1 MAG: hypothetical protein G01um101448_292 [Parcubacteria group bacterium Gr01-1014_48]TSD00858.1 MAG: hypothetical protein Greene101415_659 [Parcubacteria group bacterium Greene1014_15]TSD07940.1 MAG: hypothetical protein Greene07144_570 [Parcubacteria group bacterium Greene0714_4]